MSFWQKADSFGGLASGVAAMFVAGFAVYQSSKAQSSVDALIPVMKSMGGFFEEQELKQQSLSLIGAFRDNSWEPLTIDELRASPQAQKLGLNDEAFVALLSQAYLAGHIVPISQQLEGRRERIYVLIWDEHLRLNK
ncbi:MAG: hypothetical protein AAGF25_13485 [Pseudomonadota bacterium]